MINAFYNSANIHTAQSWELWHAKKQAQSWAHTVPARFFYLCDMIVNITALPFAIISVTFGLLHALCTLNYRSPTFKATKHFIFERSSHLFLSAFGSVISPALAHKYRDANLAPYIIAFRIVVITAGALYYGLS